jgi:hypothetical protein
MKICMTAKELTVNGKAMPKGVTPKDVAQHIKEVLFNV